jgi:hypothetical protein
MIIELESGGIFKTIIKLFFKKPNLEPNFLFHLYIEPKSKLKLKEFISNYN